MHLSDIILTIVIAAVLIAGFVWRKSRKKKGKGCCGCSGNCSSCGKR